MNNNKLKKNSNLNINKLNNSNDDMLNIELLTKQILKIIKIRLLINNISISEDKLITFIQNNLKLLDLRYFFKIKSINVLIDDLVNLLKFEIKKNDENENHNILLKNSYPKNILDFNRKEYNETFIDKNENLYKKKLKKNKPYYQQKPMKFNLEHSALYFNEDSNNLKLNYVDKNPNIKKEIKFNLSNLKEKIIEDVSKKNQNI